MIDAASLAHHRARAGLSQRKLALLTGLNYQVIRRLEGGGDDGNLTLRDLGRIGETLGIDPRALLSAPAPPDTAPQSSARDLSVAEARLLRRIHRGEDIRRVMTTTERELVLPALLKAGLVEVSPDGPLTVSDRAAHELDP